MQQKFTFETELTTTKTQRLAYWFRVGSCMRYDFFNQSLLIILVALRRDVWRVARPISPA